MKIIFLVCFILVSIFSVDLHSQNDTDYIYDRGSYLEPESFDGNISQEPPKVLKFPFSLGPKVGVLTGGSYVEGFSPYIGLFMEFPFNRWVGLQVNAAYHQYNLTMEDFRWVRPNIGSATIPISSEARGGNAVVNYLETQLFVKFYIDKFWIGAGIGINIFLGGTIKKWYTVTPPTDFGGVIDNIRIFSEEVRSETPLYLYFSLGYVTQLTDTVFLFPELYANIYAFSGFFLNQDIFTIGGNLSIGYRF